MPKADVKLENSDHVTTGCCNSDKKYIYGSFH